MSKHAKFIFICLLLLSSVVRAQVKLLFQNYAPKQPQVVIHTDVFKKIPKGGLQVIENTLPARSGDRRLSCRAPWTDKR